MHLGAGTGGSGGLIAALAAKGIAHALPCQRLVNARQAGGVDDHIVVQRSCTQENRARAHQNGMCKGQGRSGNSGS